MEPQRRRTPVSNALPSPPWSPPFGVRDFARDFDKDFEHAFTVASAGGTAQASRFQQRIPGEEFSAPGRQRSLKFDLQIPCTPPPPPSSFSLNKFAAYVMTDPRIMPALRPQHLHLGPDPGGLQGDTRKRGRKHLRHTSSDSRLPLLGTGVCPECRKERAHASAQRPPLPFSLNATEGLSFSLVAAGVFTAPWSQPKARPRREESPRGRAPHRGRRCPSS